MRKRSYATAYWEGESVWENSNPDSPQDRSISSIGYRFGGGHEARNGTHPSELIAAAHAGCVSHLLSKWLRAAGFPPDSISARTELIMDTKGEINISGIYLIIKAVVPGIDEMAFLRITEKASKCCPLSRLIGIGIISLEAELVKDGQSVMDSWAPALA